MQTDIKILVRLHHSLVLGFFCFVFFRSVGNVSTFRFHWEFSSVPCVSVRGSRFSSSPKVVRLMASCWGRGGGRKNRFHSTPRYLFVFVTTLSDTKAGLVRSSCRESRRPGPSQLAPSFEFALHLIKSMKGTNQRRDEPADMHRGG